MLGIPLDNIKHLSQAEAHVQYMYKQSVAWLYHNIRQHYRTQDTLISSQALRYRNILYSE